MDEPFLGEVTVFAFNFAPRSWAQCNGQLLPISQNQALFALLGTTYGGNGQTSFALPDLRGRMQLHFGTGPGQPPYNLGQAAGSPATTLLAANLPSHTHTVVASTTQPVSSGGGSADSPIGRIPANGGELNYAPAASATGALATVPVGGATQTAGANAAVPVMPPYLTLNACICLAGLFPSRN